MSVPLPTVIVLQEVAAERTAQDEKWGQQNHPSGTGPTLIVPFHGYAEQAAEKAKALCDSEHHAGNGTWQHILSEEFLEALAEPEIEHHVEALRRELLQVAAVAVAWVECIDRRKRQAWRS